MRRNGIFSNQNFWKLSKLPGITFHPAEITRNDPKLSQSRKIDDLQKFLENPEKYPEAFLNKSLIKILKKFLTSKWSKISNFADIQKLFFRSCRYTSGVLKTACNAGVSSSQLRSFLLREKYKDFPRSGISKLRSAGNRQKVLR